MAWTNTARIVAAVANDLAVGDLSVEERPADSMCIVGVSSCIFERSVASWEFVAESVSTGISSSNIEWLNSTPEANSEVEGVVVSEKHDSPVVGKRRPSWSR